MQWPSCQRLPKDQATGAIFILWIIFNHFGTAKDFSHFLDTDTSDSALVSGMLGELNWSASIFCRLVDHRHAQLMSIKPYEFLASALSGLTLAIPGRRLSGTFLASAPSWASQPIRRTVHALASRFNT
jgi:hypothetical protein